MVLIEDSCQNCGRVKASQCKIVSYCSKNCEISHKKEHGNVCFTTPTTQNQNLDPSLEPEETCSNKYNKPNKECLKENAPSIEAETFCQTCYRTNVALQKCSRCKTVYYCSKMCQKVDWSTHQSNCKASKTNSEVNCEKETGHEYSSERSNKKEPIKENCMSVDEGNSGQTDRKVKSKKRNRKKNKNGNSDNINSKAKDGGIDSEEEASRMGNSQKKSQVNSKDIKETGIINSGKKTDAGTGVKNTAEKCENCGNYNEDLRRCSQCKNAMYCSKTCQKSAWPLHKKLCKPSNNSNTKSPRRQDHLLKAEKLFPSSTILTRFIDIEEECVWDNWRDNTLLVAYILNPGGHFFRPSVFIQDSDGCIKMVIFYHKEPDPRPYFSWEQLKTGNYICILQPKLHYFLDGQIGFRINSIKEIRIL